MTILSSVLGAAWPGEPYGQYIGSTIGRVLSTAILLVALARLGWLRPAGFTRPGQPQAWLIGLLMLPLALFGLYLLRGLPERSTLPAAT
jgi:hypothetical protein